MYSYKPIILGQNRRSPINGELEDIFLYVIQFEERLTKFNLIYFESVNNCGREKKNKLKGKQIVESIPL